MPLLVVFAMLMFGPTSVSAEDAGREGDAMLLPAIRAQAPDVPDASAPDPPEHRAIAAVGGGVLRISDLFYYVRKYPKYLADFGSQRGHDLVLNEMIKSMLLADAANEHFGTDPELANKPITEKERRYQIR